MIQLLNDLSLKDPISQGWKFCSNPQDDLSAHFRPDDALLVVASGDDLARWIDHLTVTDKPYSPIDGYTIG